MQDRIERGERGEREGRWSTLLAALLLAALALPASGCLFLGGAAVGAAGAGAAYEYNKKRELDKLERDFERGDISKQEYLERKREIERDSVIH